MVIPKALRERAGLKPGMEVEVRLSDGNIEISPPEPQGHLIRKEGFLVWDPGPDAPPLDVRREIERLREERGNEVLGEL